MVNSKATPICKAKKWSQDSYKILKKNKFKTQFFLAKVL